MSWKGYRDTVKSGSKENGMESAGGDGGASPDDGPRRGSIRLVDLASAAAGALSSVALIAIVFSTCFEVVSRYVFNEPTVWATEYSTYLLLGMTFVGLAYAQKQGSHIRVELLIGYLTPPTRHQLEILTHWLGLFFVVFATWQMMSFNYQEYVNDTRNWGLLATPQWIPELAVSLGYGLFALAILADIHGLSRPAEPLRRWTVPSAFTVLASCPRCPGSLSGADRQPARSIGAA